MLYFLRPQVGKHACKRGGVGGSDVAELMAAAAASLALSTGVRVDPMDV